MITVTAFNNVPPFAQGYVRDLRVRWALEEAGTAYRSKLLTFGDGDKPEYRAIQPWGQVPVMQEDDFTLFESGAIVIHIAEGCPALCPPDEAGRAKMIQWVIASLNSVEPHLMNLAAIEFFYADEAWAKARRPSQIEYTKMKLASLARRLKGREWLEDRFTAGDLMMATVLRMARQFEIIDQEVLLPYLQRCEARPAFQRALDAQLADLGVKVAEPA